MADTLSYAGVDMAIICQKEISRQHVYTDDRTTYLWTEWVFDVVTNLNPQTIARPLGSRPAATDIIIRAILNQPRKELVFSQDGVVVLRTPRNAQEKTDADNGPIIERFDVRRDVAGHTWIVEMRIVARIRECPRNPGPVLISNRWRKTMDTDEDYLSCIITEGECVFDSGALNVAGTFPDQYRLDLFQPIPRNCKRDQITVTPLSDGNTYRYSFRDQERHFNYHGATRLECYQTESFAQIDFLSALAGQLQQAVPNVAGAGIGAPGALVNGVVGGGFNAMIQQTPRFHSHILVRAWGTRSRPKNLLLQQSLGMALERVPNTRNVEFIVASDRMGKFIEVQMTSRTGPEELNIQVLQAMLGAVNVVFPGIQAAALAALPPGILRPLANISTQENSPGTQGVPAGRPWYTEDPATFNEPPPNSNDTRGTLLAKIISNSLHDPCVLPPQPDQNINLAQGAAVRDVRIYAEQLAAPQPG